MGKYKIRCNAILPGFIYTPMTNQAPEFELDKVKKSTALGRLGQPEEIAQLVASDASSFITGASIDCTGGWTY